MKLLKDNHQMKLEQRIQCDQAINIFTKNCGTTEEQDAYSSVGTDATNFRG